MAKYVCKECSSTLKDDKGEDKSCQSCGASNPCHRCDCCNVPLEFGEGFWTDGDIDTKKQREMLKKMKSLNYDVICDGCFDDNLKVSE